MCRARAMLCMAGAGSDLSFPPFLGPRCCSTRSWGLHKLLEPRGSSKPPPAAAFQARPPAKHCLALPC